MLAPLNVVRRGSQMASSSPKTDLMNITYLFLFLFSSSFCGCPVLQATTSPGSCVHSSITLLDLPDFTRPRMSKEVNERRPFNYFVITGSSGSCWDLKEVDLNVRYRQRRNTG